MNRLLIRKSIHESLWLFCACAVMLFVFCWTRVWIVCQFDLQKFEPLLEQFRMFEKYVPVPLEQLLTYAGSIGLTYSEPVVILCILVWAISRGSDVVSGELSRGTLEMLLSRPIGRTRLLCVHWGVCVVGLALLCSAAWFGLYVGIHTNQVTESVSAVATFRIPFLPVDIPITLGSPTEIRLPLAAKVSASIYVLPTLNLFALGFLVLCLSILLSSLDRYRWRTIGFAISAYVVQLLMFLLSKATPATAFFGNLTFLSSYQPDAIVGFAQRYRGLAWSIVTPAAQKSSLWPYALGPLGVSLLLISAGMFLFVAAILAFRKRDLPAPL